MSAWNLYRHRNSDGSSKDWAVRSNPDGSITSRWGKTATRLPGTNTRNGIRQFDIEKQKQAKGYRFIAEVEIDADGNVVFPGKSMPVASSQMQASSPVAATPQAPPPVKALYWSIDCRAKRRVRVALGSEVRRMIGDVQRLSDHQTSSEQDWNGWQHIIDATRDNDTFELSGQIKQIHGVLPWLFLLALKHKSFAGVDIDIATESARDVSTDLKAEQDVLAFFGTDLDSIRETAEILGLLKPKLNLAAMSGTDDCWF